MKRFILLTILLSIFSGVLFSFHNDIRITKDGDDYVLSYNLSGYELGDIYNGSERFSALTADGYGLIFEPGLPMLPQLSFNLLINPNESGVSYEIINAVQETKYLNAKLYPVQEPWEKTKSLAERPFTINREHYKTHGAVRPLVKFSQPFIISGAKGIIVSILPFSYDPVENKLTIIKHAEIRIKLNALAKLSHAPTVNYDEFYSGLFLNYERQTLTPTNNYLIITSPALESGLNSFVIHKQAMGYNVTVVNTTVTGTTNTAIKAYIQQKYDNITTRPEFVLFAGDVAAIPGWTGTGLGNPYTDLNYGLLEGTDPYADAFIGRFPADNLTQLANMTGKTIMMESTINGMPKKNIYMASTDNWNITEATHNFVIDSFFTSSNGYTNLKLYTHTYGATTAQLIAALNDNQLWAVYSGHGSETSWADGPPLSQSQVNALTNNQSYPFVYSFACLTGQYQLNECFGETWVRTTNGGVTFYGSSVNSYWDEDDILEKRLFRAMFVNGLKKPVPMFDLAKIYLVQYFGSITPMMQRYIEMYNCMGDPSIYQATYGPVISHTCLPSTENVTGPYVVNAVITPAGSPILAANTKLYWSRNNTNITDSVQMTNTSGNNWTANIPGNGSPATYRYYLKTKDQMNRWATNPGGAPANLHQFTAGPDNVKPVIQHTPIPAVPKPAFPPTVNAVAYDPADFGVLDSVWVRWYKNTTSTGVRHVKLVNTSGNNFAAPLNADTSYVNYGDTIKYRIFAQDNSSMHNRDSSALFQFPIVATVTKCVGTGTAAVGYPFYTFYMDSKDNMLYTASEIGLGGPGLIERIGFNVVSAAPQVMNGFNIRMQNTALTSLSGFITTGWTTVYTGTYAVTGTGMQWIQLQNPFQYNGTQNLLVEICFNNSSYTSNSTVTSDPAVTNMHWHRHADLSSGDGCVDAMTGTATGGRPNICLYINTLVGVPDVNIELPKEFRLSQNYPNPFNPTTTISYALPKADNVILTVFDITGREVARLVNDEFKQAGIYNISFDASHLASGLYMYRIESGSFVETKKMVLIK